MATIENVTKPAEAQGERNNASFENICWGIENQLARLDSLIGLVNYLASLREGHEDDLGRALYAIANGAEAIKSELDKAHGTLIEWRPGRTPAVTSAIA